MLDSLDLMPIHADGRTEFGGDFIRYCGRKKRFFGAIAVDEDNASIWGAGGVSA